MTDKRLSQQDAYNIIAGFSGQANLLTIPRAFIDLTGDLDSALFLSQLLYWNSRSRTGWVYKTFSEWEDELSLSAYKVNKARQKLERMGLLATKVRRANGSPTVHYCLNQAALVEQLAATLRNGKRRNLGNETQGTSGSKPEEVEEQVTETTSEITAETTAENVTELVPNSVGPRERAFANPPPDNPFEESAPKRNNGSRAKSVPQYLCPYCDRLYKRRGDLTRHVRQKHGDDPDHPAIQAYRELAGKDPINGAQRAMIEAVEDVEAWRAAVTEWLGHGWRPENVGGMMERYRARLKERDDAAPTARRIVRR